jgi:phospholipase C
MRVRRIFRGSMSVMGIVSLASLAACQAGSQPQIPSASAPPVPVGNYIKHVVIIVQENRSFDNLFNGFPGADTVSSAKMSDGTVVQLQPHPLNYKEDIDHSHNAFVAGYDGARMDGFDKEAYSAIGQPGAYTTVAGTAGYKYVQRSDVQPYWTLAQQYTIGDRMFSTQSSGSYTAHQELVAGSAAPVGNGRVIDFPTGLPWGCDGGAGSTTSIITPDRKVSKNGPFPCFDFPTIATQLDDKKVTWKYYAPTVDAGPPFANLGGDIWSVYDGIKSVRYGPEWTTNISSPETNVLGDISAGKLAQVSYVIPSYANSDHSGSGSNTGPSWVTSVVNAIGESKYWKDTAVVIVWDEWGGWYDHVPPPQVDFDGLGFRVPMIVVSPYARKAYVSHTQYEFGSVLKFVEEAFALQPLATSDVRANSIVDCFDFTQPASVFKSIQARYTRRQLLAMPASRQAPDAE